MFPLFFCKSYCVYSVALHSHASTVSLHLSPLDAITILVPRSADDVYPPLREEEQDDYLLSNLDMDISPTSVIPPVGHVITCYKEHAKGSF